MKKTKEKKKEKKERNERQKEREKNTIFQKHTVGTMSGQNEQETL